MSHSSFKNVMMLSTPDKKKMLSTQIVNANEASGREVTYTNGQLV